MIRATMILWCWAAVVVLSAASSFTAQEATPPRTTIRKEILPQGTRSGIPVVVTYDAIVYEPALEVVSVDLSAWDRSTPESSYSGFYTANKIGDAEAILSGMTPQERESKRAMVTNKELLAKNTAAQNSVVTEYIAEKIFYGDYVILRTVSRLRSGKAFNADYTYKKTAEGWLFTNELAEDPFVQHILVALPAPKLPQDRSSVRR